MFTDKVAFHYVVQTNQTIEWYDKVASFAVNVQPASDQSTVLVNGVYGQTFAAFTTYSGLRIGDLVTVSGTTTTSGYLYKVKGVQMYGYGPLQHYEATLVWPES